MWEYNVDDRKKELKGILWRVADQVTGTFITMLIEEKSGNRSEAVSIPLAYKGRVSIKKRATLVIENVTLSDSTSFSCTLRAEAGSGATNANSAVQLIVTGMCTFVRKLFFFSEVIIQGCCLGFKFFSLFQAVLALSLSQNIGREVRKRDPVLNFLVNSWI